MALCVSCPSANIFRPCARPQAHASAAGASRLRSPFRAPPTAALPASSAFLTRVPLRSGRLTRVDPTSIYVSKRAVAPRATAEGSGGKPPGAGDGETFLGVYGPWKIEDSDRTEVVNRLLMPRPLPPSRHLPTSSPHLPPTSPHFSPLLPTSPATYFPNVWLASPSPSCSPSPPSPFAPPHFPPPFHSPSPPVSPPTPRLCYGKLEAALLVFVIPTLLLGHLSGLMDVTVEKGLLAVWMALFAVFAARKFTQPVKDDIGDKSVFIFQALPEQQQQELLARLNMQNRDSE
ncbi:unnamed protein product [Closterium sp. NIES-53]